MRNMRLKNRKATFFEDKFSAFRLDKVCSALGHGQVFIGLKGALVGGLVVKDIEGLVEINGEGVGTLSE